MNLFFLAAGEGTRFRPHTETLPKPAIPFCGAPLLYYSYFLAKCLSPERAVINTYHLPAEIHKVGNTLSRFGVEVVFSDEKGTLLGSAGGMAKAKDLLFGEGDFIALNADEVIIPKDPEIMQKFYQSAKASQHLSVLMVMKHPEAGKKFGAVWVDQAGRVRGFGKIRPDVAEELYPYHFIGPMYFKDRIFSRLREEPSNILHDILKQALADGDSVGIFPIDCDWFETGSLEDYQHATKAVIDLLQAKNLFLLQMQKEMSLDLELLVTAQAKILKHKSAVIDPSAELKGWVVMGAHSRLGRGASIKDSVLAEGVEVGADQTLIAALILK